MNDHVAAAQAFSRARQALEALGRHPGSTLGELGRARDLANICHTSADIAKVRKAAEMVEAMAAYRYGVPAAGLDPGTDDPSPPGREIGRASCRERVSVRV
jgi:hypothetical protein